LAKDLDVAQTYVVSHETLGSASVNATSLFDTKWFADNYTYTGSDLGNTYTPTKTSFRVWAPTAQDVKLVSYGKYVGLTTKFAPVELPMTKSLNGTWVTSIDGDQNMLAYTYKAQFGSRWNEGVDPYARATTINGALGVVVDLKATNPVGFAPATKPAFSGNPTDAVFYELHVRDASIDASSGIQDSYKGKYLGLTQHGTVSSNGKTKTGIDAIKDLGVTHVQLLPIFDYASVDEYSTDQQNWGYDPLNYNVPEGSYATNPSDPINRISELKTTIQSMHTDGLRVIMDVVYNHVSSASQFSVEQLVPGYFFRTDPGPGDLAN
jgi:pullulanase